MAKKKELAESNEIVIEAVSTMEITVCILGATPFCHNRLSEKARHELFMPSPKKNAAEKAMNLKHQPYDEYRASVYLDKDPKGPTRIIFPGGAFRKAISSAALDIPGSSKAQIGRLVRVVEYNVPIFGVPKIDCDIVRQAGMNKTPDVRTRALMPEWACTLTVRFPFPLLKEAAIMNLLAAAGEFIGVGDGRSEKGSSKTYGCFRLVAASDADFRRIVKGQGRKAQQDALASPEPSNLETEELLSWFDNEVIRRNRGASRKKAS